MSISDPVLSKKKGGGVYRGVEREKLPRVKALIITLNFAERSQSPLSALLCTWLTHCCFCFVSVICNATSQHLSYTYHCATSVLVCC